MPPRITAGDALDSPRRRQLLADIQANPGIGFRELCRLNGLARGTTRHHLNVLRRANFIVERSHGATVRLFHIEASYDETWVGVVLRRDPALATLHAWLKLNPRALQSRVLEAMSVCGWARSTTQHRLGRLVEAGLAIQVPQGRFKIYSATQPAPETALNHPGGRVRLLDHSMRHASRKSWAGATAAHGAEGCLGVPPAPAQQFPGQPLDQCYLPLQTFTNPTS